MARSKDVYLCRYAFSMIFPPSDERPKSRIILH